MNGSSERKGSCERQNNKGLRWCYDSNFKLMVIHEAEKTNSCAAARKFNITENNVRRWWQQKDELSNAHSTRMAFRGPKKKKGGRFNEIDVIVIKFITEMRLQGFPITRSNSGQRRRNHTQFEYQ
jgi:hypothetical protein